VSEVSRLRFRVAEAVASSRLWSPGDRVAVAVSGGADSIALLDLLCAASGLHGAALSVVTIDHRQHAQSAAHAAFVLDRARDRGLPCRVVALDLPPGSSEASCRSARFAVFDQLDVDRVALAHHRDDQAETVLLALIRGSGTAGLAAMAPRRDRYVRPALCLSRDELRAWIAHRALRFVEDPTNEDPRFLRNALRAQVLPTLEALRPGARKALARAASHAASDDAYLRDLAAPYATPPWPRPFVAAGPEPLVRRALLAALPQATATHLDAIVAASRRGSGRVDLPGGVVVSIDSSSVRVVAAPPPAVVVPDVDGY